MPDFRIDIIHPREMDRAEIARWEGMQDAVPALASPLLSPHFARLVGELRNDARVGILRRGPTAIGYFAHHRRPSGFARPIGAPFSDYHGLVTAADQGLEGPAILRAAGLSAFRFSGLIDPFGVFAAASAEPSVGHRIVLCASAGAYLQALAASGRNRACNFRRYGDRLARAAGPLRLAPLTEPADLARLLRFKRAQIAATGVQDFLAAPAAEALLWRVFEMRCDPLRRLGLGLFAGERLAAGHFGIRRGDIFHPWIGAADPELEAFSPGFLHQWLAIAAMDELGLRVYDLGPGCGHWKRGFARDEATIRRGLATASGAGGRYARTRERLWTLPVVAANPLAGRLRRRLDQIAQTELTLGGRLAGLIDAVARFDRRRGPLEGAA